MHDISRPEDDCIFAMTYQWVSVHQVGLQHIELCISALPGLGLPVASMGPLGSEPAV